MNISMSGRIIFSCFFVPRQTVSIYTGAGENKLVKLPAACLTIGLLMHILMEEKKKGEKL